MESGSLSLSFIVELQIQQCLKRHYKCRLAGASVRFLKITNRADSTNPGSVKTLPGLM
jgi:hypothetical protein